MIGGFGERRGGRPVGSVGRRGFQGRGARAVAVVTAPAAPRGGRRFSLRPSAGPRAGG